ncbi:hypothetical protein RB598_003248 [Gaeumannomyces tritici]
MVLGFTSTSFRHPINILRVMLTLELYAALLSIVVIDITAREGAYDVSSFYAALVLFIAAFYMPTMVLFWRQPQTRKRRVLFQIISIAHIILSIAAMTYSVRVQRGYSSINTDPRLPILIGSGTAFLHNQWVYHSYVRVTLPERKLPRRYEPVVATSQHEPRGSSLQEVTAGIRATAELTDNHGCGFLAALFAEQDDMAEISGNGGQGRFQPRPQQQQQQDQPDITANNQGSTDNSLPLFSSPIKYWCSPNRHRRQVQLLHILIAYNVVTFPLSGLTALASTYKSYFHVSCYSQVPLAWISMLFTFLAIALIWRRGSADRRLGPHLKLGSAVLAAAWSFSIPTPFLALCDCVAVAPTWRDHPILYVLFAVYSILLFLLLIYARVLFNDQVHAGDQDEKTRLHDLFLLR